MSTQHKLSAKNTMNQHLLHWKYNFSQNEKVSMTILTNITKMSQLLTFQNWTACSISLDWPTHRTYITDFSVPIGRYLFSICSNSSSWLKWLHMSHLSLLTHIKTTPCIVSYLIGHPNVAICHSWHNKPTCLNCAYRVTNLSEMCTQRTSSYKTALFVVNAHILWLTHFL